MKTKEFNLNLEQDEKMFLEIAFTKAMDDLQRDASNPAMPFTPDARKGMKELLEAGKRLKVKLQQVGFVMLTPKPGDEQGFFTKPS